jgi:Cupin-like domain
MLELFIFLIVAFLYVHIASQYKSSSELDVYEIDYYDNTNLQETCQLLQPFVFVGKGIIPDLPRITDVSDVSAGADSKFLLYDLKNPTYPFEAPASTAFSLFSHPMQDTPHPPMYYSETNPLRLHDLDMEEELKRVDTFLRPPFTIQTEYAILMGSIGATTPFRYHHNSRQFLMVVHGKVHIKLAPWKPNRRHLYEQRDYIKGEFRSTINIWDPLPQHKSAVKKMKFVDVMLKPGQILYIPSMWGYSIHYQERLTQIYMFSYSTIFNRIAYLEDIVRFYFQSQNITYKKLPAYNTPVTTSEIIQTEETSKPESTSIAEID